MSTPSELSDEPIDETVIDFQEVLGVENDVVQDNPHGVVRLFETYVRERPVKSLLIAAGIGLLFSGFWKRR